MRMKKRRQKQQNLNMSTIGVIAVQSKNGSIKAVYNNADSYIEGVGIILHKYYNTTKKATELIKHGGISLLGSEIGEKHDFNLPREGYNWLPNYNKDTAINYKWCRFYSRDNGEELEMYNLKNEKELLNEFGKESFAEFVYLFKNNQWYVKQNNVDIYSLLFEEIEYNEIDTSHI